MRKNVIHFLFFAMLLAFGSPAHAQQPTTVPRIGFLGTASPSLFRRALRHSAKVYARLGMWKGKAFSSSTGGQRKNSIECPTLRLN